MKSAAFNQFLPWVLPFILLAVWQGLSSAGILASRVLPSPVAVLAAGFHLTQTGELPLHLFESFQRAATGLMIGGSIGFLLGLLNGLSTVADRLLDSSVQMVRNIAMIPLVILWFWHWGRGQALSNHDRRFLSDLHQHGSRDSIERSPVARNGAQLWAQPVWLILERDPAGCATLHSGWASVCAGDYVADADRGGNDRVR